MGKLRKLASWLSVFTVTFAVSLLMSNRITLAASCTADCGGDNSVTCTGIKCNATDGSGCIAYNGSGQVTVIGMCC